MSHGHYNPADVADPYGNPHPPQKKPYLIYGLIAAVVLGGMCCVLSCIPLAMFGFQLQTDEVASQIRDIPEFREEIGELRTIEMQFRKSSSDNQNDTWYYEVTGDKGSGELFVRVRDLPAGKHAVTEATLRTRDGAKVSLPIR